MKKLFPIILALIGLGAGLGVGMMLKPAEEVTEDPTAQAAPTEHSEDSPAETGDGDGDGDPVSEFVKLNNQFIVPVVEESRITAMVVLSLSLEVDVGTRETVYKLEPKLTDAFLQVMFDHANHGGFSGVYTQSTKLNLLRTALLESANAILGGAARSILVTNLVRQDT